MWRAGRREVYWPRCHAHAQQMAMLFLWLAPKLKSMNRPTAKHLRPRDPKRTSKEVSYRFPKQTNTTSARIKVEQTHLWREVQEMGGLISGGAVRASCEKETPTGRVWARGTAISNGQTNKFALWWHTPHSWQLPSWQSVFCAAVSAGVCAEALPPCSDSALDSWQSCAVST